MQIVILAVGKLKEKYWKSALAEYVKRLSAYATMEVIEVADEGVPENASEAQIQKVKEIEADRITKHVRPRDGIVVLDIEGKMLTSEAWSRQLQRLEGEGFGRLLFVIGGSHGLHDSVLQKATFSWSFGPLTLPHQLARVVLVEQLYRGFRIARGEPYHK